VTKTTVLVNDRHKHFKKLMNTVFEKIDWISPTFKEKIEIEDIKNYDILFSASKFTGCDEAEKLIYLQIKYPTRDVERQKILNKFEEDYEFYINYLNENANIVIEKVDKKLVDDGIEVYNKTFIILKPNNNTIIDRIIIAFDILKMKLSE
jgi:hypothetical protein